VNGFVPIGLIALGGIFVGGVISLRQQGAGRLAQAIVGVLALLAVAGGVLYLVGHS
jgi:hypothetical protein